MAPAKRQRKRGSAIPSHSAAEVERLLQFDTPAERQKCDLYRSYEFSANRYLHQQTMEKFGISDTIHQHLARAGWEAFASIICDAYLEPTIEFLSTLTVSCENQTIDHPDTIQFRLNRQQFSMSLNQFNVAMGFETDASILLPAYQNAFLDFPSTFSDITFWGQIGVASHHYNPSSTKSTFIRDPVLRLLHRFIAHSIAGRQRSTGVVTKTDLFYLWCLVQGQHCNLGYWFIQAVQKLDKPKGNAVKRYIAFGSYISNLARNLNALHPQAHLVKQMEPIDEDMLKKLEMLYEDAPGHWAFRDGPIPAQQPAPPADAYPYPAADIPPPPEAPQMHTDVLVRLDRIENDLARMDADQIAYHQEVMTDLARMEADQIAFREDVTTRLDQLFSLLSTRFPPP